MNLHRLRAVSQHLFSDEARCKQFSLRENRAEGSGFWKRMPWNRLSRIAKVSIGSVAMVFGLASCTLDYYADYVYMTTSQSSPGVVNEYAVDFQSGALSSIGTVNAGNDPVKLVAAPNGTFVYVINQGDSTVQEFAVQSNGTLVSKNVYPTGNSPSAIAIDPQGAHLYVTYNYQSGTSGPGGISIYPVNSDNSLGAMATQPIGNNPVGIVVSYYNHFVYVLDQEAEPNATVLGFSQNTTTGALTPVPGTTISTVGGKTVATGYLAGVIPSAIAEEPTARFVYVTDQASNQLIGYTVQPNGGLVPMINGPFATGLFPVAVTVGPTGTLLYIVNYNANSVSGYAIDTVTGTPSGASGATGVATGTGPTCVSVDPALGTFLYVSDSLDNTVTAERVTPNTGALAGVQNSPFPGAGKPTCLTTVPNGAHASQIITP